MSKLLTEKDLLIKSAKYNTYYATFGFGHDYENCYTIIIAENRRQAFVQMLCNYGTEWAFMYNSKEKAGVYEYNLKYIPTKQG